MTKRSVGTLKIALAFFTPLVVLLGMATQGMGADTVKIGEVDAFSGPFEMYGRAFNAAVDFAVAEQNKKGGLLGKRIEILKEDSQFKPDLATRGAKKLVLEDKVNFLTGGCGSNNLIAMGKVAAAYKTILINYGGMSDIIQGKEFNRYTFRVCQNSHNFTAALAQLLATKPYRKFYILCQDYAWGHDVSAAFKEQLKIHVPDAEIVGEDFHPLGSTHDFAPYLNKVIAAKADAIFTGNFGPDLRLLIKQGRTLGLKPPFPFVTTFGVDPYQEQELGEDSIGIIYAYDYTLRLDTPENQEMIRRYREHRKGDTDVITNWPWDTIGHAIIGWQMTFAAVEKAGSLDPEKIIEAFEGMWYKTPVGWWMMRKCDHQVILPMFGGIVEGGKNPFYNFPWLGPNPVKFPALESAIPPTKEYNERCP